LIFYILKINNGKQINELKLIQKCIFLALKIYNKIRFINFIHREISISINGVAWQ